MSDQSSGDNAADNSRANATGSHYSLARRANATGRSTSAPASRRVRDVFRSPEGDTFVKLLDDMLESPAYQVICSSAANRVLTRIIIENQRHAGRENGRLKVTHDDFEAYGVQRKRISSAIAQLVALGLLVHVDRGRRAYGEDKGKPAMFELTWLPVVSADGAGIHPRRGWERHATYDEAKAAFEAAAKFRTRKKSAKLRLVTSAA